MSSHVFTGARAIFKVNSKKVAFASGCDGTEEVMYEAVDVLDNIEVAEYAPTGYRVTFNAAVFRTIDGLAGVTEVGTPTPAPSEGQLGSVKAQAVGLFPQSKNILTTGAMNAEIIDRLTKTLVVKLEMVKAQTLNFSIQARSIVGQNVSFNAIRMKDESETA